MNKIPTTLPSPQRISQSGHAAVSRLHAAATGAGEAADGDPLLRQVSRSALSCLFGDVPPSGKLT